MNICKNCKYWKPINGYVPFEKTHFNGTEFVKSGIINDRYVVLNGSFGNCDNNKIINKDPMLALETENSLEMVALYYPSFGGEFDAEFETHKDFGCIHFENKDEKEN